MKRNATKLGPWMLVVAMGGAGNGLCACADSDGGGGEGGAAGGTTTGEGGTAGSTATGGGGATTGATGSPPPALVFEDETSGGSGCPDAGQVSAAFDAGTGTLTLDYSSMALSYPPGGPIQHVHCATGFRVELPSGWEIAAAGMAPEGTADLPTGAEAVQSTQIFFAGEARGTSHEYRLIGPRSGPYAPAETVPSRLLDWSPCGGSTLLTVNVGLTLRAARGSPASASIDLTRVKIPIVRRGC